MQFEGYSSKFIGYGIVLLLMLMVRSAFGQSEEQPLLVRQTEFKIPFQVSEPNATPEVQLMVSNDRGANWISYQRQSALRKQFVFQAHADGEYWFAIRTYDRAGRPTDSNSIWQPELRVAVDTQTPVVNLEVRALETGEVIAKWMVRDPLVDPEAIHISYQTAPQTPFQPVEIDIAQATRNAGVIAGETRFFPFATERVMQVRIDAYDKVGNAGVAQQTVSMPLIAARQPWYGVPKKSPNHPDPSQREGDQFAGGNVPVDPFQQRREEEPRPTKPIQWPEDNSMPGRQSNPAPAPSVAATPTPPPLAPNPHTSFHPASMQMEPPVANSAQPPTVQARSESSLLGLPPGVTPQHISQKRFALNYGVSAVGPSGVGQIELWVTRNGGQTWEPSGIDPDRQSPFDVEVQNEGLFGFRIVVEGGNGLVGRRPQAGDLADIWVNVDFSRPIATITNVIYGQGARVGQLEIQWEANDKSLAARPISLYFSPNVDGPWKPIVESTSNTGKYVWQITQDVPLDVFLRITAADQAGNIGEFVLPRPIANDGLVPNATIKSIAPVPANQEQAGLPVTIR